MLKIEKTNFLALSILCVCFCSCNAADVNSAGKEAFTEQTAEMPREDAVTLIWELQRLYVLCGKLEPQNSEALSKQYRESNLIEFEEFLPIDKNPFVAMVNNSEVYNVVYVKGDPKVKSHALGECKTQYPVLLEKFRAQKATLKRALMDKSHK